MNDGRDLATFEQRPYARFELAGDDGFSYTPELGTNLTQWRFGWRRYEFPQAVDECFRHLGRSNTAWLDGHVTDIRKSDGQDVPVIWYTGGRQMP